MRADTADTLIHFFHTCMRKGNVLDTMRDYADQDEWLAFSEAWDKTAAALRIESGSGLLEMFDAIQVET